MGDNGQYYTGGEGSYYYNNVEDGSNKRPRAEATDGGDRDVQVLRKMMQVFEKEQLINMMMKLAEIDQAAFDEFYRSASADTNNRKIFIRGLSFTATREHLEKAFCQYGPIADISVMIDKNTGRNKGYAFLTFQEATSCYRALERPSVTIDGRSSTINLACIRPESTLPPGGPLGAAPLGPALLPGGIDPATPGSSSDITLRKLFIRGLNYDTPSDVLKEVFGQYGELDEATVICDRMTGKSKGFGFVIYRTVAGARKALENPHKEIQGRVTTCNLAVNGPVKPQMGGEPSAPEPVGPPMGGGGYGAAPGFGGGGGGGPGFGGPGPGGFPGGPSPHLPGPQYGGGGPTGPPFRQGFVQGSVSGGYPYGGYGGP